MKILFSKIGTGWQAALKKCGWLEPHFLAFESAAEVAEYCRQNDIEVIVGVTLKSQLFLIEHQDFLRERKLVFIVNDKRAIKCFGDKRRFQRFMVENGLGRYVPEYYDTPELIRYPCIIKMPEGSSGKDQRIVQSPETLGVVANHQICSEYIPGNTEFASNLFYSGGMILNQVTYKKTFDKDNFILGQDQPAVNERVDTPFLDIFGAILEKTAFTGICCFDYKIHNGVPKIFEINGRIGYTLVRHGDDFQSMLRTYLTQAGASLAVLA